MGDKLLIYGRMSYFTKHGGSQNGHLELGASLGAHTAQGRGVTSSQE